MPIFISYAHKDKSFADSIAQNLVRVRHNVWIDTWEINAGESLIARIQEAVGFADAIIVVLSQNSINSEWCKKELHSGLIRELEEKNTILIPCRIDDCEVPLFLREKLYVDFRDDADKAFSLLDRSLRRISNPHQSRVEKPEYYIDWAVDWGNTENASIVEWLFVQHSYLLPYCTVARITVTFEGERQKDYAERLEKNEHVRFAADFLEYYVEKIKNGDARILITDNREKSENYDVIGSNGNAVKVHVAVRRLGQDNGMDTLVSIDHYIMQALKHTRGATRNKDD